MKPAVTGVSQRICLAACLAPGTAQILPFQAEYATTQDFSHVAIGLTKSCSTVAFTP
jgi:hypothetical protein